MSISKELSTLIQQVNVQKKKRVVFKFNLYTIISTWFCLGLIPFMPGTIASISVYPIYKFMISSSNSYMELQISTCIVVALLFVIGWFAVRKFETTTMSHDHKSIVIDEVIGQLLVIGLSFKWLHKLSIKISSYTTFNSLDTAFIIALIAFRFFDIKKPFLIRYIDRNMKGAMGVILDDVMAALFAAGSIFIAYKVYDAFTYS